GAPGPAPLLYQGVGQRRLAASRRPRDADDRGSPGFGPQAPEQLVTALASVLDERDDARQRALVTRGQRREQFVVRRSSGYHVVRLPRPPCTGPSGFRLCRDWSGEAVCEGEHHGL